MASPPVKGHILASAGKRKAWPRPARSQNARPPQLCSHLARSRGPAPGVHRRGSNDRHFLSHRPRGWKHWIKVSAGRAPSEASLLSSQVLGHWGQDCQHVDLGVTLPCMTPTDAQGLGSVPSSPAAPARGAFCSILVGHPCPSWLGRWLAGGLWSQAGGQPHPEGGSFRILLSPEERKPGLSGKRGWLPVA